MPLDEDEVDYDENQICTSLNEDTLLWESTGCNPKDYKNSLKDMESYSTKVCCSTHMSQFAVIQGLILEGGPGPEQSEKMFKPKGERIALVVTLDVLLIVLLLLAIIFECQFAFYIN